MGYLLEAAKMAHLWQPAIKVVKLNPQAKLPKRANEMAVGFDVFLSEAVAILPGKTARMKTGVAAIPPPGTYLRINGRSGLSSAGYFVQCGVIDPDYTGQIEVVMTNSTADPVFFNKDARIAQLIPEMYSTCTMMEVDMLGFAACATFNGSESRGSKGFGSTGF